MLRSTSLRKPTVRLQVEALEDRALLSGISLAGGKLSITGTPRNDQVTVSLTGPQIRVDMASAGTTLWHTFNASEVSSIAFDGKGGFDRFTNNTAVPGSMVNGSNRKLAPQGRKRPSLRKPPRKKKRGKLHRPVARFASPAAVPGDIGSDVNQIYSSLNALRAQYGRGALTIDPVLQAAAQQHANNMAAYGYGDGDANGHILFGQDGVARARQAGYQFTPTTWLGENVAYNYGFGAGAAQQIMAQWTSSPGHFQNMVRADFTKVGIGVAYGWFNGEFRCYAVQMFATP